MLNRQLTASFAFKWKKVVIVVFRLFSELLCQNTKSRFFMDFRRIWAFLLQMTINQEISFILHFSRLFGKMLTFQQNLARLIVFHASRSNRLISAFIDTLQCVLLLNCKMSFSSYFSVSVRFCRKSQNQDICCVIRSYSPKY